MYKPWEQETERIVRIESKNKYENKTYLTLTII